MQDGQLSKTWPHDKNFDKARPVAPLIKPSVGIVLKNERIFSMRATTMAQSASAPNSPIAAVQFKGETDLSILAFITEPF